MTSVHLVVRGRVQGVGFRWFVARRARALGLAGAVRNRADGAVEVDASGPETALRALVEAVREGPSGARVSGVDAQWGEAPAPDDGFHIEPS